MAEMFELSCAAYPRISPSHIEPVPRFHSNSSCVSNSVRAAAIPSTTISKSPGVEDTSPGPPATSRLLDSATPNAALSSGMAPSLTSRSASPTRVKEIQATRLAANVSNSGAAMPAYIWVEIR